MTTKTDIANLSMLHLGIGNTISDVATDTGIEAASFNKFYDLVIPMVLSDFDWPFARKKATLAGQTSLTSDEYLYSYTYPTDCATARRIPRGGYYRNDASWSYVPFVLRLNATDSAVLILTDEPTAQLVYTKSVTTISLWPSNFVMAFSYRMASYMAASVTSTGGDPFQMSQRMVQFYNLHLHQAQATVTNEERPDQAPESEFTAIQRR